MSIQLTNAPTSLVSANQTATPAATTSAPSTVSTATSLASNLDVFLKILTTQLTNQNPLSPLDADKFTSQLTEFATVEQSIGTNTRLDELKSMINGQKISEAMNYVGKEVTFDSPTNWSSGNGASWFVTMPEGARAVNISIQDASGNTKFQQTSDFSAGSQWVQWDGLTTARSATAAGAYTLTITANNPAGDKITPTIRSRGVVDSADVGGTSPKVAIGGLGILASDIKRIAVPPAPAAAATSTPDS